MKKSVNSQHAQVLTKRKEELGKKILNGVNTKSGLLTPLYF